MEQTADDICLDLAEMRRQLLQWARRWTVNADEAEDLAQEAIVRVWRGQEGFEGRSAARSWAYRILRNCFITEVRRTTRQRKVEEVYSDRSPQAQGSGVDAMMDHITFQSRLARWYQLGIAGEADCEMMHLLFVEGASASGAATSLGLRPGAVRSRLSRLRGRIRHVYRTLPRRAEEKRTGLLDTPRPSLESPCESVSWPDHRPPGL